MNRRKFIGGVAATAAVSTGLFSLAADSEAPALRPITATEVMERQREFAAQFGEAEGQFTLDHLSRVKAFLQSHAVPEEQEYVFIDMRRVEFS